jgi:glycosyltransferase involved in cell wall biosynthesis
VTGGPVAIDARRLQDAPLGGVGRALARVLPPLAGRQDLVLLTDARREPPASDLPTVALRPPGPLPEVVWLQGPARRWARRHPDHLFHGTFNALPAGLRGPGVVTIHDLSFEEHPEDFGAAKRRLFQQQARSAARRARTVITVSRFSAGQLRNRYGTPAHRLEVIPHAVDPGFGPDHASELARRRPELADLDYVVALGGAARRGLEVAVDAWRAARDAGAAVDLVVVGGGAPPPEPGLHGLGRCDDATWAAVLAGARALVYPTRYEGFGLPALEAAARGTPVVGAAVASLPGGLGDAAAWAEAPTVEGIGARLGALLRDPAAAEDLREAGLARAAAAPSWDDVAEAHAAVYEAAWR